MPRLPRLTPVDQADPHVFILGAGASIAACPLGDRQGRSVPAMMDLVDMLGLRDKLEDVGIKPDGLDFEAIYDSLVTSGEHPDTQREIEDGVQRYFADLQLPDEPTVYDYLLLSLRPKDLVATFNWDPFLAQAFQRNRFAAPLPQVAFLHGNVEVGYCREHRRSGWIADVCDSCGVALEPTPLLYPVRDKDYTADPFIENEWRVLRRYLARAYFLTIFGYSAPKTDQAARDAMMSVWKENGAKELAEVEIIDIKPEKELHESWSEFITRSHYLTGDSLWGSYLGRYPRRSCDGLAAATLQNTPWKNDRWPAQGTVQELQAWFRPLVDEENELAGTNRWFSGTPCHEIQREAQDSG